MSKLIVMEGPDGSGKSTLLRQIEVEMQVRKLAPFYSRQPGGSPTAEKLRDLLLDSDIEMDPYTQALLFLASRHEVTETLIRPLLKEGRYVLTDRFDYSTRFYQSALMEEELSHRFEGDQLESMQAAAVSRINRLMDAHPLPDDVDVFYIILDAPDTALNFRLGLRPGTDRFESQGTGFQQRLREKYRSLPTDRHSLRLRNTLPWDDQEISGLVDYILDQGGHRPFESRL